jgi:hypothetical protein
VAGTLHAVSGTVYANTRFEFDFYDNPSGGGQGQTFVGLNFATTDANGDVTFAFDFAGSFTALTATATLTFNIGDGETGVYADPVAVIHL